MCKSIKILFGISSRISIGKKSKNLKSNRIDASETKNRTMKLSSKQTWPKEEENDKESPDEREQGEKTKRQQKPTGGGSRSSRKKE